LHRYAGRRRWPEGGARRRPVQRHRRPFLLAPGVYSADAFSHKSPERVQIIGAGADKTILRGNLADDAVLWLEGNPASSVSSLTIEPTGVMTAGLVLHGADARQVAVGVNGAGFTGYGAALFGGAIFDDGRVDLGQTAATRSRSSAGR
jgi:hypothetical protein